MSVERLIEVLGRFSQLDSMLPYQDVPVSVYSVQVNQYPRDGVVLLAEIHRLANVELLDCCDEQGPPAATLSALQQAGFTVRADRTDHEKWLSGTIHTQRGMIQFG